MNEVRGDSHEDHALADGLSHSSNVEMLEITQPAVDDSQRGGGGGLPEISFFHQRDGQTSEGSILGCANAVDAAADDQKIVFFSGEF